MKGKFWSVIAMVDGELPNIGTPSKSYGTLLEAMDHARELAQKVQGKYFVLEAVSCVLTVLGDPVEVRLKAKRKGR